MTGFRPSNSLKQDCRWRNARLQESKESYEAPKCHKDTRKAIIKDITSWVLDYSKDTLILWISAPAGSGKSAISQNIAERFQDSGELAASNVTSFFGSLQRYLPLARISCDFSAKTI